MTGRCQSGSTTPLSLKRSKGATSSSWKTNSANFSSLAKSSIWQRAPKAVSRKWLAIASFIRAFASGVGFSVTG